MLTFGTEIVILYIAEECVRLRPIPPAAGYFLYYGRTQAQVYTHIIHLKKCVVYHILYVLWYAYYEDSKSVDISMLLLL